ncbi:hypothetical protein [Caulifigura coniformis]|nr:hypothetical protein [Caulifigura coniformis]
MLVPTAEEAGIEVEAPVRPRPPSRPASRPSALPASAPRRSKPADDDFLTGFDSDEFEDLPVEPEPRPKPVKKKPKKKKSSRSRPFDTSLAWKGGIAAAVVVCVLVGWKFAAPFVDVSKLLAMFGGGGTSPDLTWLPDGIDAVGEVRVSELVQAPVVNTALQSPQAAAGLAMMKGMLDINLQDVESVRFGIFASPSPMSPPRVSGVVILSKPGRIGAVLEGTTFATPPGANKVGHGSRFLYTLTAMPTMTLCCLDDRTLLFGGMNELKAVLDKEGRPESTSRFGFLDKRRQFSLVIAPPDMSTASGFLGASSFAMFKATPVTGLSFAADVDSALRVALSVNTKSSKDAADAKVQFDQGLSKMLAVSPLAAGADPSVKQALQSAKATVSGRTVAVTLDLPVESMASALAAGPSPFGLPSSRFSTPQPGFKPLISPTIPKAPVYDTTPPSFITEPSTTAEVGPTEMPAGIPGFGTPASPMPQPSAPAESTPPAQSASPFRPVTQPQNPARRPSGF